MWQYHFCPCERNNEEGIVKSVWLSAVNRDKTARSGKNWRARSAICLLYLRSNTKIKKNIPIIKSCMKFWSEKMYVHGHVYQFLLPADETYINTAYQKVFNIIFGWLAVDDRYKPADKVSKRAWWYRDPHISNNWRSYCSKIRRHIWGTRDKSPIAFIGTVPLFSFFFSPERGEHNDNSRYSMTRATAQRRR